MSFDYKYDGNGNRTAKTGIQGLTAGSSALDIRYQYDVRGQLLEECRNGAAVRYAYDAAGNRIRKTEGEKETRYRYNQKNQLLQKEDADGISCFTYDRQGGIIEEKTAAGIRRFTYNSLHQQTQVETETGNIQKNRYDAEGLRYELIENGRRTSFIYHNGELLHERGEEAGLSKEATSYHLGAGIEAFQRDSKTFYYHQDEQLNTTLISDENAAIRNHYQYDAFGAGLEAAEALPNRIRYTGQQYDEQTEQYYLRARYYNPVLGRFMQEDVYQGDGLNLYAYCQNNPVIYYDPSGFELEYNGIPYVDPSSLPGLSAEEKKNTKGIVTGTISNRKIRKMSRSKGAILLIPPEIANKFIGKEFDTFDKFKAALYKEIGNSKYVTQFINSNQTALKKGNAPFAPRSLQTGGNQNQIRYNIHHIHPVEDGGDVYNLDNLIIYAPKTHKDVHAKIDAQKKKLKEKKRKKVIKLKVVRKSNFENC